MPTHVLGACACVPVQQHAQIHAHFLFGACSFSLSRTHARRHAHTYTRTHTHSLTLSLSHTRRHTRWLVVRWSWYYTSKSMPKRFRTRKTSSVSRYLVFRTCNVKKSEWLGKTKVNNHKLIWRKRCRTHFGNFSLNFIQSFFLGIFLKDFCFLCAMHFSYFEDNAPAPVRILPWPPRVLETRSFHHWVQQLHLLYNRFQFLGVRAQTDDDNHTK